MSDWKKNPVESSIPVYAEGEEIPKGVYWFDLLAASCVEWHCSEDWMSEMFYNSLLDFRYCHTGERVVPVKSLKESFGALQKCIEVEKSRFVDELENRAPELDAQQVVEDWIQGIETLIHLSNEYSEVRILRPMSRALREELGNNLQGDRARFNRVIERLNAGESVETIVP